MRQTSCIKLCDRSKRRLQKNLSLVLHNNVSALILLTGCQRWHPTSTTSYFNSPKWLFNCRHHHRRRRRIGGGAGGGHLPHFLSVGSPCKMLPALEWKMYQNSSRHCVVTLEWRIELGRHTHFVTLQQLCKRFSYDNIAFHSHQRWDFKLKKHQKAFGGCTPHGPTGGRGRERVGNREGGKGG